MALDFPDAPTDGQVYEGFAYSTAVGAWGVRDNTFSAAGVASAVNAGTATVGDDTIYTWTSSGTVTIATGGLADILVIGGGGGGGYGKGGGGGAGGHLYIEDAYLPSGTLDVIVGAGGAGAVPQSNEGEHGNNGEPSRLGSYFVPGGGAGSSYSRNSAGGQYNNPGLNGASGGGAGGSSSGSGDSGGLGFSILGNDGGSASGTGAGGGGGSSTAGSSTTNNAGGNGGDGTANSITGSSVTRAAGGGGVSGDGTADGTGGTGGGGDSAYTGTAGSGAANTGSGGGATASGTAGSGGSGVVIIRIKG